VEVAIIVCKRLDAAGRVAETGGVEMKRLEAVRGVKKSSRITKERIRTGGRVSVTRRVVHQCVVTQKRVVPGDVAALLRGCSRLRRKRKAGECDKRQHGMGNIRHCFHAFISSFV